MTPRGALSPTFAQNKVFFLKIASKLHDFEKKNLGGKEGPSGSAGAVGPYNAASYFEVDEKDMSFDAQQMLILADDFLPTSHLGDQVFSPKSRAAAVLMPLTDRPESRCSQHCLRCFSNERTGVEPDIWSEGGSC